MTYGGFIMCIRRGDIKCCSCNSSAPSSARPPLHASEFFKIGKPWKFLIYWKHSTGHE